MTVSNLFNGKVTNESSYKNLASVTGITFVADKKYSIQVQSGACYFCEKASDPSGGFLITPENGVFTLIYGNPVFVKKYKSADPCTINIAGED